MKRPWALCASIGLACGVGLRAQSSREVAEEDIKQAVVMIEGTLGGVDRYGAGILVGTDADSIYIATANHVVRQGGRQTESVRVLFRWRIGQPPMPGTILPQSAANLDLAVVRVAGLQAAGVQPEALPFEAEGDPTALRRGEPVYLVGNPGHKGWRINTTPEKFSASDGPVLEFESTFLTRGHSGGALLNKDAEIVGLLKSEDPPYGEAIDIRRVTEQFRQWGLPVQLGAPPKPRALSFVSAAVRSCALTPAGVAYCWGPIGTFRPAHVEGKLDYEQMKKDFEEDVRRRRGDTNAADRGFPRETPFKRTPKLQRGTDVSSVSPRRVRGNLRFKSISAGTFHTCGITVATAAYCWGSNEYGQLGDGSKEDSMIPARVSGNTRFRSLFSGVDFTCGIAENNGAYCWGRGSEVGYYAVDLEKRRRVGGTENIEDILEPAPILAGESVRSIIAGGPYWSVVTTTGKIQTYFEGFFNGPEKLPEPVEIDSMSGPCALAKTGDAYCNGSLSTDSHGGRAMVQPPGGEQFVSLSASLISACGVTKGGAAYCWGDNRQGQLGNGSTTSSKQPVAVAGNLNFDMVSVGGLFACGIAKSAVYCWGTQPNGADDERQWPKYGPVPVAIMK